VYWALGLEPEMESERTDSGDPIPVVREMVNAARKVWEAAQVVSLEPSYQG
jgi:hypothetical protein